MNLEDYWQENKRFVQIVALGVVVFFFARWIVNGRFEPGILEAQSEKMSLQSQLNAPMFTRSDLSNAQADGDTLDAALAQLRDAVEFAPRPGFSLEPGSTASSQYLRRVQIVKDSLLPLCNRSNMVVDDSLGLPELSPTREDDIERYLAALDLVDRVTRLAVDANVARVDEFRIALDPAMNARGDPPAVERTRVQVTLLSPSGPLVSFLERLQRDPDLGPMIVSDLVMRSTTQLVDEARLELTLVVARLHTDLIPPRADGAEEVQ